MLFAFHRLYVRAHLYTVVYLLYNIQWRQMRISTVVHTFMCTTHTHTHTHIYVYIHVQKYALTTQKEKRENPYKNTDHVIHTTWCIPRDAYSPPGFRHNPLCADFLLLPRKSLPGVPGEIHNRRSRWRSSIELSELRSDSLTQVAVLVIYSSITHISHVGSDRSVGSLRARNSASHLRREPLLCPPLSKTHSQMYKRETV